MQWSLVNVSYDVIMGIPGKYHFLFGSQSNQHQWLFQFLADKISVTRQNFKVLIFLQIFLCFDV